MDLSHPVFKEIATVNYCINQMERDALCRELLRFGLSTRGSKMILKRRLKSAFRQKKLISVGIVPEIQTRHDFFVVIDFEATCEENNKQFVSEIIEFPAVLVDAKQIEIVGMFREFCRPVKNPILTDFCKKLTGMNQTEVKHAREFPEVLCMFEAWLKAWGLGSRYSFAVVTDGRWDIVTCLVNQCRFSQLPIPAWSKEWINVRKTFSACYNTNVYYTRGSSLIGMLDLLGMQFEGRPHCGKDDARNIARIICSIVRDGGFIKPNESLGGHLSSDIAAALMLNDDNSAEAGPPSLNAPPVPLTADHQCQDSGDSQPSEGLDRHSPDDEDDQHIHSQDAPLPQLEGAVAAADTA